MILNKSILGVAAAISAVGVVAAPSVVNAWGDNTVGGRPSYTIEQINDGILGNKIVFNSISNSKIGDEKNFVAASETCIPFIGGLGKDHLCDDVKWYNDTIEVSDGGIYTIRLYVHNNSPLGMGAIAEGVKTTFALPTTVANSHNVVGYIDSSNADITRYWDEVQFVSDQDFYLEYLLGSAKYTNAKGTVALSDDIIINGTAIGYEGLDGKIPGCYEYDGVVTIDVKVNQVLNSKLKQTVRIKGTKEWFDTIDAKVGDEVEYQLEYTNFSDHAVKNVMLRDALPENLEYVAGSTKIYNQEFPNWGKIDSDDIVTTGINIGNYAPKGNAYIRFTAKVVNTSLTGCGAIDQLVNWAGSTTEGQVAKDNTVVRVKEGTCAPAPTPTPTPEPEPEKTCKTNPEMEGCKIPETGASDMIPAALGAGAITTALGYYIASRKKLM